MIFFFALFFFPLSSLRPPLFSRFSGSALSRALFFLKKKRKRKNSNNNINTHITGPGSNIAPRSATAITATAPPRPPATRLVPSRGSTATSTLRACGAEESPTRSPQ